MVFLPISIILFRVNIFSVYGAFEDLDSRRFSRERNHVASGVKE